MKTNAKHKDWRTVRDNYIQWYGQHIYIQSTLRSWRYNYFWCEEYDAGLVIFRGRVKGRRKAIGFVPRQSNGRLAPKGFDLHYLPDTLRRRGIEE